jgi:transposase
MGQRNFTDEEEAEIAKLYTVGGFSIKAIMRAYGYKHHISFSHALKRQGVKQRSKAERNRLYKLNPHVFDTIDNEHKAYWLGFIYADGCVHRRSLQVYLKASDKIQIKKLKEFLESESPIKYTSATAGKTNKRYKQVGLTVTDQHLVNRLRSLGITPERKTFSYCIGQIEPELHQHWIRGYFDGDGSFHSYKPGMGFCGQISLLAFIRSTFAREIGTNLHLQIYKHPKAKIHYLTYMGRPQCKKIAKWLYKDATIWMQRKRDVVENYPEPQVRTRDKLGRWQ